MQRDSSDCLQRDPVLKRLHENSSFGAVKGLVEAQNNVRVAHNRIKVLHINDNKNSSKIANQLGLIHKIEKVREFSNDHHNYLEETKQQVKKQAEENRCRLLQVSQKHKLKLKEVYQDLKKGRQWRYHTMEQQSQEAQKQIQKSKSKQRSEKSMNRSNISKFQQAGRESVVRFHEQKQQKLKEIKTSEVQVIKMKQSQKHKELRDLGNLQMQLLKRQSQSQVAYQQVKGKLDSMLNRVKQQHNKSKNTLKASIHLQLKETET